MKSYSTKAFMLFILGATFFVCCKKTTPYSPSTTPSNNRPPVADAGQDQTILLPVNNINLSASESGRYPW